MNELEQKLFQLKQLEIEGKDTSSLQLTTWELIKQKIENRIDRLRRGIIYPKPKGNGKT